MPAPGDNALEALMALVPAPDAPVGAPFDWTAVEAALGTALPADYKAYCDRYGHGHFHNGWGWFPFTPGAGEDSDLAGTYWRDLLADLDDVYRPFPDPGGVLPFSLSELNWNFWWLAEGEPDAWPVLVWSDSGEWTRFDRTATEMLVLALQMELFPGDEDEPPDAAEFFPDGASAASTPEAPA